MQTIFARRMVRAYGLPAGRELVGRDYSTAFGEGLLTSVEMCAGCSGRAIGTGRLGVWSQLRRQHGEAGVDLGVDGWRWGSRSRGGGVGVLGAVGRRSACGRRGRPGWAGWGALGADVGEFDQGGEGGAEGFGVFPGALHGFRTACWRALLWAGESGRRAHQGPSTRVRSRSARRVVSSPRAVKSVELGGDVDAAVVGAGSVRRGPSP